MPPQVTVALVKSLVDASPNDVAIALDVLRASFATPAAAIQYSGNARALAQLGLADDVLFCSQLDVTHIVPELTPHSPWPLHLAATNQHDRRP